MSNIEKVSWETVEKMILEVAKQIKTDCFYPDYIAPIPKGGWAVASLLAQYLNIKRPISLAQTKTSNCVSTYVAGSIDVAGKRVLIVEDSIETGRGLFGAKAELNKRGAEVKTFALYISPAFKDALPDYFFRIGEIPLFPWEIKYN